MFIEQYTGDEKKTDKKKDYLFVSNILSRSLL